MTFLGLTHNKSFHNKLSTNLKQENKEKSLFLTVHKKLYIPKIHKMNDYS